MAVDLNNLNKKQLADLITKAKMRQEEIDKEKVTKLRAKIVALAKAEGYTIDELFGTRGVRKTRRAGSKVPPKYRNPADPAQTWSGRGKRPNWFHAALKAGKKEKDLLIK
jgi:DNA-binding protein H-NS